MAQSRRSAPSYAGKARLTAEDRRRQLLDVGLLLLTRKPLYALSVDEVAAEAGISRGLLFHYFPTKTDYFSALVRSAGRRVLHNTEPDPSAAPDERLHGMVQAFVEQVDRRRESYLSIARGTAGPELRVSEVYDELRAELTERVVLILDVPDDRRSVVHAWWGYVEDRAIAWSAPPSDIGGRSGRSTRHGPSDIGGRSGRSTYPSSSDNGGRSGRSTRHYSSDIGGRRGAESSGALAAHCVAALEALLDLPVA